MYVCYLYICHITAPTSTKFEATDTLNHAWCNSKPTYSPSTSSLRRLHWDHKNNGTVTAMGFFICSCWFSQKLHHKRKVVKTTPGKLLILLLCASGSSPGKIISPLFFLGLWQLCVPPHFSEMACCRKNW